MLIRPVDYFLVVWFALAAVSTAYVAWDQYRNNPEPTVMKWGFILVTLYMGPLGLLLYVLADKEPRPGEHEKFIQALWKQGAGSTIHCVAGDATGIILAAAITATLGLPMWIDLIVEYATGFAFGLFIFQSLFMKSMMGGTYWENVRKKLHAGIHQHEFHDGRDGPCHELSDDGARHAGDGANRASVLGCDVVGRDRRFHNGLPRECLDGKGRPEARLND